MMKTFNQKVKALKLIGHTTTIEDEEHLDYELRCIKDSAPDMYQEYLNVLSMIK